MLLFVGNDCDTRVNNAIVSDNDVDVGVYVDVDVDVAVSVVNAFCNASRYDIFRYFETNAHTKVNNTTGIYEKQK